jgi:hypothetical protein
LGQNRRRGDILIHIVIGTGASISITGDKQDFVNEVTPVDPNCHMQGLNNLIRVEGIGLVQWKICDQIGHMEEMQMMAYYILGTTI